MYSVWIIRKKEILHEKKYLSIFFYKIHSYFDNIEGQQIKSHDGYQIMIYQIQPKDPHVPKGGKWLFF